jgi:hypothetical protein
MADLASTNGHDLTDAEARAAAQDIWHRALAAGEPLTGADLGHAFGKTDRWGRKQIERARSGHELDAPSAPSELPTADTGRARPRRNGARAAARGTATTTSPVSVGGTPDQLAPTRAEAAAEPEPAERSARRWLDAIVVLVVAAVAAAASYGHMLEVALAAGEPLWIARAFPFTVDGLAVAALRRGEEGRHWLALAVAVSVSANVLAQFPEHAQTIGPAVSAWPPLALYGTHRLLQR